MMHTKEEYIAVFDSGVGGLSVLRELMALMPRERYLYFGDSANAPYGAKTTQQVQQLTLAAAERLMQRPVKALVVACNTATAAAISLLRQHYPDTIIVGIEPALKLAAARYPQGTVGIMATEVTLREEKLANLAQNFPEVTVRRIAAPGLVERIEAGDANSPQTRAFLESILLPHRGQLDALVLGCTHYPFVADVIGDILGPETCLLDGGPGTARQTQRCLAAADLLYDGPGCLELENSLDGAPIRELSQLLLRRSGQ